MQTNGDMQIRGVGIHAVGPLVIFLAQWLNFDTNCQVIAPVCVVLVRWDIVGQVNHLSSHHVINDLPVTPCLLPTYYTSNLLYMCYFLAFSNKNTLQFVICPIAIAYSMGQIIKSVCVCLSVCLSVCHHSHGRISLSIFTKFDRGVNPQK